MGITVPAETVFTSALATAQYLSGQDSGRRAFVVGEHGLVQALTEAGFEVTDQSPHWVVAGLDRHVTYDVLRAAAFCIESGARFVGTNPDTSLPTEYGLEPGAGAILAAIVATTGVQPTVIGKPQPLMLRLAMESLGGTTVDTAMLGDRLDTDIAAAAAAGMRSILVLTGVSTREDLKESRWRPDLVVDNLGELMATWESDASGAGGTH
jgi:HAD superfamily hydrolase (TIGR01457 family)